MKATKDAVERMLAIISILNLEEGTMPWINTKVLFPDADVKQSVAIKTLVRRTLTLLREDLEDVPAHICYPYLTQRHNGDGYHCPMCGKTYVESA